MHTLILADEAPRAKTARRCSQKQYFEEGMKRYNSGRNGQNKEKTNQMTKNALKLLSNDSLLERFKTNAYQQAMKFDIEVILPKYEKLYEQCVDDYLTK